MSATLAGLTTIITAQGLDIIFLQEVRLSTEQLGLLVGKQTYNLYGPVVPAGRGTSQKKRHILKNMCWPAA